MGGGGLGQKVFWVPGLIQVWGMQGESKISSSCLYCADFVFLSLIVV